MKTRNTFLTTFIFITEVPTIDDAITNLPHEELTLEEIRTGAVLLVRAISTIHQLITFGSDGHTFSISTAEARVHITF